jgi:hypothetical protein
MAQVVSDWRNQSIPSLIVPFRRRKLLVESLRIALIACAIATLALLFTMWLDLIWALPATARWVITRLGAITIFAAGCLFLYIRFQRVNISNLAISIDQQALTGGQIIAGLELEKAAREGSGRITAGLAAIAADQAGNRLSRIDPAFILPLKPAKKPLIVLASSLFVMALLAAIMPSLAWNQFQRFLFPSRDVPQYTGTIIVIEPTDATVRYGEDLSIKAIVKSGEVERMHLVTIVEGKERIVPMLPEEQGTWQAVLIRVTEPMDIFARSGSSRSSLGHIKVALTPKIESVKIRIQPPEYTRRAAYEGPIPAEGIVGLAGTRVEFFATSNRPLSLGQIHLQLEKSGEQLVALQPLKTSDVDSGSASESREVSGSYSLTESGSFSLTVSDIAGTPSTDKIEGKITVVPDQRPIVRILERKPYSLATPDIQLPVVVAAEDDYGISSLEVFRSLNNSIPTPMSLSVDGGPRQNNRFELPLPSYGLEPGDEIRLFARAEDNDPQSPKGSESPVTVIYIISTQEFQEMMLEREGAESMQAKYNAAQRHLENLADAIRQATEAAKKAESAASEGTTPESEQANQELNQKLTDAQKTAAEAARAMQEMSKQAMPIDVDQDLAKELAEMAKQTAELAEQLKQMAESQAGTRPLNEDEQKKLEDMAQGNKQNREDIQNKAIEPLNTMQAALPLMMAQDAFQQLVEQQRDLSQRLESLRNSENADDQKNQRRASELEAEQEQLRQSLDQLLDQIEQQADKLPDDEDLSELKTTAQEFAQAVRDSEAMKEMANAQQAILSEDFPQAHQSAETAADILEKFLKQCEGMSEAGEQACKLKFSPSRGGKGLGKSLHQIRKMMKPGNKPGSAQGLGKGNKPSNGFSQRAPGPQNVGMYGAMPSSPPPKSQRGQSDKVSQGTATVSSSSDVRRGANEQESDGQGAGGGQSDARIPSQYRNQVQEYFRRISEQLGDKQ